MSAEHLKTQVLEAWKDHMSSIHTGTDGDGNVINTIDVSRTNAIEVVKIIMHNFMKGDFDINDFKTALDSYNKHNNLWGFTAKLGQMYFNQLIKAHENNPEKLSTLLKDLIAEPKNLRDALSKIETLEKLTLTLYTKSKDKYNAPYPGAVGFFLSYFWQIYNHQKWPILYNTLINSFKELGVWEDQRSQKETYELYYNVYNDIKKILDEETGRKVSYWEIEHVFWNYKPKQVQQPVSPVQQEEKKKTVAAQTPVAEKSAPVREEKVVVKEALSFREYIIPRLARLLDEKFRQDEADTANRFDTLVAEACRQLDFEVEVLDQSKEKDACAILRFREENVAFILDAFPAAQDYYHSADRRVIKEYVNENCNRLRREGYRKISYWVVCGDFDDQYQPLVSYINWNTDIKKTILMSTGALLYMLAHKLKHRQGLYALTERMAGFPQLVNESNIAAELNR